MYRDEINKDTLKVGDVVGVRVPTQIGWGYFRYPKTFDTAITRITPARNKFVTEKFGDMSKNDPFYKITPENDWQTTVALCAQDIIVRLRKLDKIRSSDGLNSLSDVTIVKLSKMLEECVKEMESDLEKGSG